MLFGRGRVTIITGRKMDLGKLDMFAASKSVVHIPKNGEDDHNQDRDHTCCPVLSFPVDIDETEDEGSKPKEPLHEGCQNQGRHQRDIHHL